jgi:DNA-binding NarL/FixJ family response regulator
MDNGKIRVLIADDHALICEGLKLLLEREGLEVVGVANTGRQAVDMTLSLEPDVLMLNIRMPEMDGLQALAAIKSTRSSTGVVMHTAYSRPEYLARAIALGASGFVLKDRDPSNLPDAIRAVAGGEAIVDPELLKSALRALSTHTRSVHNSNERGIPDLTPQELRILQLIAEGLSNTAIANVLCVSKNTVKTHLHNLLTKIGASDRTQAVIWAMKHGLVA